MHHRCLSDRAALDGADREARKQDMINLSVEYQVVTSGTSFVAVEERTQSDNDADTPTPSVSKLAGACSVDRLAEQGWRRDVGSSSVPPGGAV